MLLTDVLTGK